MISLDKKLIPTQEQLYIAVSGGSDSIALSHFLSRSNKKLTLIYVNHRSNYADTAQDNFLKYVDFLNSEKVRSFKHPIKALCLSGDFDVKSPSEEDYRKYRYDLFSKYFESLDFVSNQKPNLVLCHHLGDAVESYLMNGLNGNFRTIPKVTNWFSFDAIRPFLKTSKDSIERYLTNNDLNKWVTTDPTNTDISIRRNWVRLKLIPMLKENYPGIDTVVRKKL